MLGVQKVDRGNIFSLLLWGAFWSWARDSGLTKGSQWVMQLWNSLPVDGVTATSKDGFKKSLGGVMEERSLRIAFRIAALVLYIATQPLSPQICQWYAVNPWPKQIGRRPWDNCLSNWEELVILSEAGVVGTEAHQLTSNTLSYNGYCRSGD